MATGYPGQTSMRRLTRSSPAQVAPNTMLRARFEDQLVIGAPYDSPRAELGPLYGRGDIKSIFTRVGRLRWEGRPHGHDIPVLRWDVRVWHRTREGRVMPQRGQEQTCLFTGTTKNACPSFSLPAGPEKEGGTCAAANPAAEGGKGLRKPGKTYTCDGCYALEGNYFQAEVSISHAARYHWVVSKLEADPTGQALAADLTSAIVDYARFGTMAGSRDATFDRLSSELGTWNDGRIRVPLSENGRVVLREAFQTPLPADTGTSNSCQFLSERLSPQNGEVTGFFRIHDSGDFTIGRPSLWAAYARAWGLVAKALPKVLFWAPTRAWMFPTMVKVLAEAKARAPNLIVRPSALHVGDEAPVVPGLDAGTTVFLKPGGGRAEDVRTPGASYPCPVYVSHWDEEALPDAKIKGGKARALRGELGEWVEDKSCQAAGCRRCWADPIRQVAYGWH